MHLVRQGLSESSGHSPLIDSFRSEGAGALQLLLEKDALQVDGNSLLLSSENFGFFTDEEVQSFASVIRRFGRPIIVVYLRRQDFWIESIFRQTVRHRLRRETRGIREIPEWSKLDYLRLLSPWVSAFGLRQIKIGIYSESLVEPGCLLRDFFRLVGVPEISIQNTANQVNPSLPSEIIAILRKLNQGTRKPPAHEALIRFIVRNMACFNTNNTSPFFLPPEERLALRERLHDINLSLADQFGLNEIRKQELCCVEVDEEPSWVSPETSVSDNLAVLCSLLI